MPNIIQLPDQPRTKFKVGAVVITQNALGRVPEIDFYKALRRHVLGDWGDVSEEDRRANEESLVTGARLLSVYHTPAGERFWIITEADRSATTILLPEDY